MPLPKPKNDEKKQKFVARCIDQMSEKTADNGFPNRKQGGTICNAQWDMKKEKKDDQS